MLVVRWKLQSAGSRIGTGRGNDTGTCMGLALALVLAMVLAQALALALALTLALALALAPALKLAACQSIALKLLDLRNLRKIWVGWAQGGYVWFHHLS